MVSPSCKDFLQLALAFPCIQRGAILIPFVLHLLERERVRWGTNYLPHWVITIYTISYKSQALSILHIDILQTYNSLLTSIQALLL